MPTATSLSGLSLFNIGPLTTTFTASASCLTAAALTYIVPLTEPDQLEWGDCDQQPAPSDCNPNGSLLFPLEVSAEGANPTAADYIVYYSPGLLCPSGWTTDGIGAKINPTSFSVSGAYNVSFALPTNPASEFEESYLDILLDALEPGESAVLCCPSSYAASYGGQLCVSSLPSSLYVPKIGCKSCFPASEYTDISGVHTIDGSTVTGLQFTITGTTPILTSTTTFAPSDVASVGGIELYKVLVLVHHASDITTSPTAGTQTSYSSTTSTNPQDRTGTRGGLSSGAKTGIGIGVGLGVLFVATLVAVVFWCGKQAERKKQKKKDKEALSTTISRTELGPGVPRRRELEDTSVLLNNGEMEELQRRRRTAELEGAPISPVGVQSERAELEALRGRVIQSERAELEASIGKG